MAGSTGSPYEHRGEVVPLDGVIGRIGRLLGLGRNQGSTSKLVRDAEVQGDAEVQDRQLNELGQRTRQDTDQSAADLDQTQADSDQNVADRDQAASDSDQALSDRDQHSSERDQAAADREQAQSPGDTLANQAHDVSRQERHEVALERESTANVRATLTGERLATASRRDEVARIRDATAATRDRVALARDDAAAARDRAADEREQRATAVASVMDDSMIRLRSVRIAAAAVREQSARERAAAATDRAAAAADRKRAADDRRDSGLDDLTGILRRGAGELAVTHEIDRSRRSGKPLVLAIIDVDRLKAVNDGEGHAAGDALLYDVAESIVSTLRSYDVAMRWGGDEFVCALSDVTGEIATGRVAEIQRALETCRPGASISAGLAQLEPGDTIETLFARADSTLCAVKARRRVSRS